MHRWFFGDSAMLLMCSTMQPLDIIDSGKEIGFAIDHHLATAVRMG
jgi:hypothetical protein